METSDFSFTRHLRTSLPFKRKFYTTALLSLFSMFSGFIYLTYGHSIILKKFKTYTNTQRSLFNLQLATSFTISILLSYFPLKNWKRKFSILLGLLLEMLGVGTLLGLSATGANIWLLWIPSFMLMFGFNLGINLTFQYYMQDLLYGREGSFLQGNFMIRFGAVVGVMMGLPWVVGGVGGLRGVGWFLGGWYAVGVGLVVGLVRETVGKGRGEVDKEFEEGWVGCWG